jgi:hypothetical protein
MEFKPLIEDSSMRLPAAQQHLLGVLKDERSRLHDLVWELDEVEVALAELEAVPAAAPELDDQQADELEHLRQRYDALQETVLTQMLYIERLEARYNQLPYPAVRAA